MERRILFPKGMQKSFFNYVKTSLMVSSLRGVLQFGFDVPYSTLKSYYSERLLLPETLFIGLCHIAKIDVKSLNFEYLDGNWGRVLGGHNGIKVVQRKYPEKIKNWRRKGMLNSPVIGYPRLKKIKIPKLNENLAEFIGAYLGDGTITPYQLRIAGDYRYDLPYYSYLTNIIFKLFGIRPIVQRSMQYNNSCQLVISSKRLCSFVSNTFNIKYGDKIRNKTVIPKLIINNKRLAIACLRGLIDTDGSISRRGYGGRQFCIQFTSHNKYLLNQVIEIGKKFHLFTFSDETGAGTNSWESIQRYFKIVGSSNLKHIIRFYLRKFENKSIYRNEVEKYFKKDLYRNLILPFKI